MLTYKIGLLLELLKEYKELSKMAKGTTIRIRTRLTLTYKVKLLL
jgi:hypothetical protein